MIQTKTEIQKIIRKEKPLARLMNVKKDGIYYTARLGDEQAAVPVFFKVPLDDIGDAKFEALMPSQLLIKHLIY